MADGWLRCHKAGAEEGNNQPSTMKTNKKPKGKILQGMKQGLCTEEVFCAYMRESIRGAIVAAMRKLLIHIQSLLKNAHLQPA
jgi:hypothetical protein